MLIVSKFKDYYDNSVGISGLDKTIIYQRYTTIVSNQYYPGFKQPFYHFFPHKGYLFTVKKTGIHKANYFALCFCGKIYIGFEYSDPKNSSLTYYYYGQDIVNFLKQENTLKTTKYYNVENRLKETEQYINTFHLKSTDLCLKYNAPIVLIKEGSLEIKTNVNLKELDFGKNLDSFSTFQQIQFYISGVLKCNEKEPIEISDKHKVLQHGFDEKYGFRKRPKENR